MVSHSRNNPTPMLVPCPMARRLLSLSSCLIALVFLAVPASAGTLVLPQLAIGGSYTTTITVFTGGTAMTVNRITLRDQKGNPLVVKTGDSLPWSEASFNLPPLGTQIWKLEPASVDSGLQVGWASITYDSNQGTLYGMATYEYRVSGVLRAAVGVLGSEPLDGVTLSVDSDDGEGRYAGFAIANVATDNLDVTVTLFDLGGTQKNRFSLRIAAQAQTARFLVELVGSTYSKFKGLMVLKSASGGKFAATALSQRSDTLASVPVIPTALYPF